MNQVARLFQRDVPIIDLSQELGQVVNEQGQEFAWCASVWTSCTNAGNCAYTGFCANCKPYVKTALKSCCAQPTPAVCINNGLANGAGSPLTTSAAKAADPNAVTCQNALAVVSSCEANIANFDNLDPAVEASCACYNSAGSYTGDAFDSAWSSCAAFAATSATSAYADLTSAYGFCATYGSGHGSGGSASQAQVTSAAPAASVTGTAATATGTTTTTSTGTGTGTATGATASRTGGSAQSKMELRLSGVLILSVLSLAILL